MCARALIRARAPVNGTGHACTLRLLFYPAGGGGRGVNSRNSSFVPENTADDTLAPFYLFTQLSTFHRWGDDFGTVSLPPPSPPHFPGLRVLENETSQQLDNKSVRRWKKFSGQTAASSSFSTTEERRKSTRCRCRRILVGSRTR